MNIVNTDTLKGRTILVVAIGVFLFYIVSLILYIFFSASTVTLEREAQIADRVVSITRLIEDADVTNRAYLASEVSGPKFRVSVDKHPLINIAENRATKFTDFISVALTPSHHHITADYSSFTPATADAGMQQREVASKRLLGIFRIHENLLVSVDLPDGDWLNFHISGSAWDHIFSFSIIPSLTLMAIATLMFTLWAMRKPLKSLSQFAKASEDMGLNVQGAQPLKEEGPEEIRNAARAFNQMQSRVQRLLDARNHMLGAISHDFRTPLTRLRLRVESLLDETQRKKAIGDLEEMEAMIQLTLALARDGATEESREVVNITDLIRQVINGWASGGKKITLLLSENIHTLCQPIGMRRVLSNIIGNGVFYGSQVWVSLRCQDDSIVIDIDDDGPGIEMQERHKVFTPFYRLEASRNRETGGAGLGLWIAESIIREHGGTIELLDSEMGGLRARITLPTE